MILSDDAYVLGFSHFPSSGSTLSFGGDHAKMRITSRARAALDELIAGGFVTTSEPTDSWPNREHYKGVKSVLPIPKDRPHLNPFGEDKNDSMMWKFFVAKNATAQKEPKP